MAAESGGVAPVAVAPVFHAPASPAPASGPVPNTVAASLAPTAPHFRTARPAPAALDAQAQASLFELPVSRGARWARILAILALDAVLAGAGIAMIVSYLHARERAQLAPPARSDAGMAEVNVLAPIPARATPAPSKDTPDQATPNTAAGSTTQSDMNRQPATDHADDHAGTPARPAKPGNDEERSAAAREPRTSGSSRADRRAASDRQARTGAQGTTATASDLAAATAPAGPSAEDIGRISREIALIVNRNTAQLQRCYHQAARATTAEDSLAGRLDIHVEITSSGRATNVYPVNNTSGSESLARCVTGLFESWTYPRPSAQQSLELVWPIQFKAPP